MNSSGQPGLRLAQVAVLVLLGGYLGGCTPDWEAKMKREDIKPGDADYPVPNPHPTHVLQISGALPETLHIRFVVRYNAVADADGALTSGKYCGYKWGLQLHPEFSVTDSLDIVRAENRFHASVIVDKYLPGRCAWHLEAIEYTVLNGAGDLTRDAVALMYRPQRDQARLPQVHQGPVDEWCKKNPRASDPNRPEQCSAFSVIQLVSPLSSSFLASIPENERESEFWSMIFPDTQSFEINFHDLDAMEKSFTTPPNSGTPH
jgi:hypothetical protein